VPFLVTHDGRTIRYPDPLIHANDTVQVDIATGKITDYIKFDSGKEKLIMSDFHWLVRRPQNVSQSCVVQKQ